MRKRYLFFIAFMVLLLSQITAAAAFKTPAEINALYYNLSESKLQSFKCQVGVDAFDKIKERLSPSLSEDERQALDNIQFYLSYENGNFNFETSGEPKFQNENTNQGLKKVLDGIHLMVTGTFTSWKGVIAAALITGAEKYRITANKNGYVAAFQQTGNDVELIFNKDYLVQKATYRIGNQTIVLLPEFEATPTGLLINKMDLNIGNGQVREIIAIAYQDVKGIPLPASLRIKLGMGQVNQDVTLTCSDYEVTLDQ